MGRLIAGIGIAILLLCAICKKRKKSTDEEEYLGWT